MGLDMYLEGRTFNWERKEKRDGFRVKGVMLELGYWRKHPDLHGYIVQTFANGVDECQVIELNEDALENILQAVKDDRLPKTTGFFFGTSGPDDKAPTIAILTAAIEWLRGATPPRRRDMRQMATGSGVVVVKPEDFMDAKESRHVFYEASW